MPNLPIIAANPVDTPELYDRFKLAGQWSPGVCKFDTPPKRVTGWDLQVPSGTGGGYTVKHREPPISFTLKIYLWKGEDENGGEVDHFAAWENFKKLLVKPIKKNSKTALDIYHPLLAGLQPPCTNVVVASDCEPAPDGVGGATVEIVFDEYRPLIIKPVVAMTGTSTQKSDPFADLEKKVAEATDTFNSL